MRRQGVCPFDPLGLGFCNSLLLNGFGLGLVTSIFVLDGCSSSEPPEAANVIQNLRVFGADANQYYVTDGSKDGTSEIVTFAMSNVNWRRVKTIAVPLTDAQALGGGMMFFVASAKDIMKLDTNTSADAALFASEPGCRLALGKTESVLLWRRGCRCIRSSCDRRQAFGSRSSEEQVCRWVWRGDRRLHRRNAFRFFLSSGPPTRRVPSTRGRLSLPKPTKASSHLHTLITKTRQLRSRAL